MGGYGLLGEKLGHSFSPRIHALLGDTPYDLYEKRPNELESFLLQGDLAGMNVTIPYKKTVMQYCAALTDVAQRIGSVNTLVRRADGSLLGDNTDYYGFDCLLQQAGFDPKGKKTLVLGSGGASLTVQMVLQDRGAAQVVVISRNGENHYGNLDRHADADMIVNTTPVGMYPKNGVSPVDLRMFPKCSAVVDVIYNPARTALMLQAEDLGIPCAGGLTMLVAQAVRSAERFLGRGFADGILERVLKQLKNDTENIILIGMPGCGKSALGRALAEKLGKPFVDADQEIIRQAGKSIPDIFAQEGEVGFRKRETEVLRRLGSMSGQVIATGGGCVTREENKDLLRQNGKLIWVQRPVAVLPTQGRPLSQRGNLEDMAKARMPLYADFADEIIDNSGTREAALQRLMEVCL